MSVIESRFRANKGPQSAFFRSKAYVIGYGGAMGGGKSRALCERALDYALECPGVEVLLARQKHTAIVETTKKTMMDEVLPRGLVARAKASLGEDFVELVNGSTIHFIGLDDPVRWFSSQIGVFMVDQVEECEEDTILQLITRVGRDRNSPLGEFQGDPHPGKVILSFNPANPGHWLQRWFFEGAQQTKYGFYKDELWARDASEPLGDAEFFFAKPTDNPHLHPSYVKRTLGGMPKELRRRYLEGIWEFITGTCYFDIEALTYYQKLAMQEKPLLSGHTEGDVHADWEARRSHRKPAQPLKIRGGKGPLTVWRKPVQGGYDGAGEKIAPHRYIAAVDVSSGGAQDYSAIQVVDIEEFEQVAEYQGKSDPDLIAVEAYRIGRIYNDALIVPEITGGWGFSVQRELERLHYPKLYTKRILDRLSKRWTDRLGWDTTAKSRAYMLDTLERVIREKELGLYSLRSVNELGTFVRDDSGRPAAQPGCNDDLVVALAIAVTVAAEQPRQLRRIAVEQHRPQFAVTGY